VGAELSTVAKEQGRCAPRIARGVADGNLANESRTPLPKRTGTDDSPTRGNGFRGEHGVLGTGAKFAGHFVKRAAARVCVKEIHAFRCPAVRETCRQSSDRFAAFSSMADAWAVSETRSPQVIRQKRNGRRYRPVRSVLSLRSWPPIFFQRAADCRSGVAVNCTQTRRREIHVAAYGGSESHVRENYREHPVRNSPQRQGRRGAAGPVAARAANGKLSRMRPDDCRGKNAGSTPIRRMFIRVVAVEDVAFFSAGTHDRLTACNSSRERKSTRNRESNQ